MGSLVIRTIVSCILFFTVSITGIAEAQIVTGVDGNNCPEYKIETYYNSELGLKFNYPKDFEVKEVRKNECHNFHSPGTKCLLTIGFDYKTSRKDCSLTKDTFPLSISFTKSTFEEGAESSLFKNDKANNGEWVLNFGGQGSADARQFKTDECNGLIASLSSRLSCKPDEPAGVAEGEYAFVHCSNGTAFSAKLFPGAGDSNYFTCGLNEILSTLKIVSVPKPN